MMFPDEYVKWLRRRVDGLSPSLDIFFDTLLNMEYVFTNPRDINRALDGKVLRKHWEAEAARPIHFMGACSVLEFLVALADRMNDAYYDYENPDQTAKWFWVLINNMGMECYENDYLEVIGTDGLVDILVRMMNHDYAPDGSEGGLFPLRSSQTDQRVIEVWYQLQNYLMENW